MKIFSTPPHLFPEGRHNLLLIIYNHCMNLIRVILDRHFPYGTDAFKNSQNVLKKISLPKALPPPLARIYHVLDIYYQSYTADVVLGNRRTALLLGLLYQIHKPAKVSLIGYEIIFNFKNNLKNKLVKLIWRLAVRKIDKLVVMTQSERNYLARAFHTTQDKFSTINFYAEDPHYLGPKPDGYIFSAGRMERDFETLIHALNGTNYPAIIVADESQKEKLEKIKSPNIQIYYNIPRGQYLPLLHNAKLVVVPLYEGAASRGQVVILEAMKHGKPLVCTKVKGTVDYLTQGQEGFFVEPQDAQALRGIFDRIFNDQKELERIGKQAFATQQTKFTIELFYSRYNDLIRTEFEKKHILPDVPEQKGSTASQENRNVQTAGS